MNKVFFVIVFLFCGFAFSADSVTAERVVDGDTIEVLLKTKVRLWLVDTPETRKVIKQGRPVLAESHGAEAKQFTAQWLEQHKDISIEIKSVDSYGRLVVLVKSKEQCLNLDLVRNGLARIRPEYARSRSQKAQLAPYLTAEQEAKSKKIGVWSSIP
jgi:endonuclease YncB( thermonuclease family)